MIIPPAVVGILTLGTSDESATTFQKKTNFSIKILASVQTPEESLVPQQGFEFLIRTAQDGVKK